MQGFFSQEMGPLCYNVFHAQANQKRWERCKKRSTDHTFWSQQQTTQNGWSDIWFML